MHTPSHRASIADVAGLYQNGLDADLIYSAMKDHHAQELAAGGDRVVVELHRAKWNQIHKAANRLINDGLVVEYGFSCTELADHSRTRAIAVETRAGFINRQAERVGLGFRVGAVVGVFGTLCALVAHLHGDAGRYCYTAMGVMIALWLCSESTLRERRNDLRAKLQRQRWSPIERTDATDCIRA